MNLRVPLKTFVEKYGFNVLFSLLCTNKKDSSIFLEPFNINKFQILFNEFFLQFVVYIFLLFWFIIIIEKIIFNINIYSPKLSIKKNHRIGF
jgi:hypothetical protein